MAPDYDVRVAVAVDVPGLRGVQLVTVAHVVPGLLDEAVYGLVEVYREQVAAADLVASPGCYPTGVLLALFMGFVAISA